MARRPTETVQVNLRMKESLRRQLEDAAKANELSLNAEMIRRLEKSTESKELRQRIEELRQQIKYRDEVLDALTAQKAIHGDMVAGWVENEFRSRGLHDARAKEMIQSLRAFFGGLRGAKIEIVPPGGSEK